jgi:Flp pilus assembly protein TadD
MHPLLTPVGQQQRGLMNWNPQQAQHLDNRLLDANVHVNACHVRGQAHQELLLIEICLHQTPHDAHAELALHKQKIMFDTGDDAVCRLNEAVQLQRACSEVWSATMRVQARPRRTDKSWRVSKNQ